MSIFSPIRGAIRLAWWVGAEAVDWVKPDRTQIEEHERERTTAYIHGAPKNAPSSVTKPVNVEFADLHGTPTAPQVEHGDMPEVHVRSDAELVEKERDLLTTQAGGRRQRNQTAGLEAQAIAAEQVSRRRNL